MKGDVTNTAVLKSFKKELKKFDMFSKAIDQVRKCNFVTDAEATREKCAI